MKYIKLSLSVLILSFISLTIVFSQEKIKNQSTKRAKKENDKSLGVYFPLRVINIDATKETNPLVISKLEKDNLNIQRELHLDENHKDFMYDYYIFRSGDNDALKLVDPEGNIKLLPKTINLIDVFKDGTELISDPGEIGCSAILKNVRLVKDGKIIKNINTNYYSNGNYSNENSYAMLVDKYNFKMNMIDQKGNFIFDKDQESIKFLFPNYISFYKDKDAKFSMIMELSTKKVYDLKEYDRYITVLRGNRLLELTRNSDSMKVLMDPITKEFILESDKLVSEIEAPYNKDFLVKDYYGNTELIDRKGKTIFSYPGISHIIIKEDKTAIVRLNNYNQNIFDFEKGEFRYPNFYKSL